MVCVNDLNNTYVPCSQHLETPKLGSQQRPDKSATVRKKKILPYTSGIAT